MDLAKHQFSNKSLETYLNKGFKEVDGWCSDQLFYTIDLIASCKSPKVGGCCEIGVHHGKFFLLLNQVIEKTYKSFAIDIFERQYLNIDRSGRGDLEIFKGHLLNFDRHKGKQVEVISGDSSDTALRLDQVIEPGSIRFFSVDGGHTAEHTINDLLIAARSITNTGVVILDDITNHHWMGVMEGVSDFLRQKPMLVPFAIGHNKLYLCKLSYHKFYYKLMDECAIKTKNAHFFGHKVVAL